MRIKRKELMSQNMFVLLMLLATIVLTSIGYSAMNSITGEIAGKLEAEPQTGVFITNVEYVSDTEANLTTSEIQNYLGTMMNSRVQLSSTNGASEITYKVTVYNNSETSYPFLGVLYDEEFYDNENIEFEIAEEHYSLGEFINPKESKDIYITFKYKDGVVPESTILNSYINFKITEPNRMVLVESFEDDTNTYLGSTVVKNTIESIAFKLGKIAPTGTIAEYSFDASEKQDESIMGYYTDTDSDGLYELTFASNEIIFPNVNAQFLFCYLTNLTNINFDNFSTYGVTSMYVMFNNCSSLTTLDVSSFDTGQVTDMYQMFYNCSSLTSLDVSSFNTSQVTIMSFMFYNCSSLTSLDLSSFDTSQVTTMYGMFWNCSSLTSLDVSSFNTSQVTTMRTMFNRCSNLTSLDLSKFDTSKVTTMKYMFVLCSNLESLNVSNFNTSNVTDMEEMLASCSKLTSLDLSSFNTSQVTTMYGMFWECSSLTSLGLSSFDTSQVTTMYAMFYKCSSLTSLDLSSFDTSQVTNMYSMFNRCSSLTSLDLSNFNTSQVTTMKYMFVLCSNLESLNVSNFNTSNVTTMEEMFSSCSKLTSLDLSSFDTSNVTTMYMMFYKCSSLTSLDLSSFNTSKVTNMYCMFYYCSNLTTIYVSEYDSTALTGWTTESVTNSTNMFSFSRKLVGGNGTVYTTSYQDGTYARIDTASTPGYLTNKNETEVVLNYVSVSEIFDAEGTNANGLHIGDFVNYDAGTWTSAEISAIQTGAKSSLATANGTTSLPSKAFQFGGFTAGMSRNGNATPSSTTYNYVKDAGTGSAVTGWRIFDVDGDTVTLISAGNPEDYYHPSATNGAYISEYILTGNINSSWSTGATDSANYQKRDWSAYVNTSQKAESAQVLTKSKLDNWYTKYTDTANADTWTASTFQKIYTDTAYQRYQNMIDNYSYYWLSAAYDSDLVYRVSPYNRNEDYYFFYAYGVRVLVSLSSEVKFLEEKAGTKTVTGGNTTNYGGDKTYNVWDIK